MRIQSAQVAVWAVASILYSVAIGAAFGQTAKTVKIGVNESLSGSFVGLGVPPAAAVRMAVKEMNDKGGFKVGESTYKLELVEADNQSTTASAVAGMIKLVEDEKVKFVFGPTLSALANQVEQIALPAHVIELSGAASWQQNGDLSDPNKPFLFGTQMPVARRAQLEVLGFQKLGAKKVAYISEDDDTTKGSMPSFIDAAKEIGIDVIPDLFPPGTADYSAYASRAKGAGAEGVYFLYPQSVAGDVLRYVVNLDAAPKGFGGLGLDPALALKTVIGKPIPIPFFSAGNTPSFAYPANDKLKDFVARLSAFEPRVVGATAGFAFFSYDFVPMLVEAMQKAGTVDDTAKIANVLKDMTYDGVAGKICFGKTLRTATMDGGLIMVQDGKVDSQVLASSCK